MNITVIGRGNIGGGLADLWERTGHQVSRLGRPGGHASGSDAVLLAVPGAAVEAAVTPEESVLVLIGHQPFHFANLAACMHTHQ